MSRAKTWCDLHQTARVPRSDGKGSKCPRCFAEQQERYRREVLGRAPRKPVAAPAERLEARRASQARYGAWRTLHAQFSRHMRRHCDRCAEAFR